jgi:hypothetical protein
LFQRRFNSCTNPTRLVIHWDAYFDIGDISPAHGLPAHIDTIAFPVAGRNAPGPGSFSAFQGQLHYAIRNIATGQTTDLGVGRIQYFNPIRGARFFVPLATRKFVPFVAPGNKLIVWGDVVFTSRGCPGFFGAVDGGDDSSELGTQGPPPPDHDPTLPIGPDDPSIFMDMMPFPEILDPPPDEQISATADGRNLPRLNAISNQVGTVGNPLSFTATATDPDGDTLTFGLGDPVPPGASITSDGVFNWTPSAAGIYVVKVQAIKTQFPNIFDEQEVVITVNGTNQAPTLDPIADQDATIGSTLTFTATATDPDGDDLTFSLQGTIPPGASITPSGVFTWTPADGQGPRSDILTVRVTDNGTPNLWHERQFRVRIHSDPNGLSAVGVDPASVQGGNPATGTVTLNSQALIDVVVSLSSSNPGVAAVAATVTVPAGQQAASFTVTTNPVAQPTLVGITASLGGANRTADLIVTPPLSGCATVAGPWRDAFDYLWQLNQDAYEHIDGTVNVGPSCPEPVWTVAGYRSGSSFTIRANNPTGGDPDCVAWFDYQGSLNAPACNTGQGTWINSEGFSGTWSWIRAGLGAQVLPTGKGNDASPAAARRSK